MIRAPRLRSVVAATALALVAAACGGDDEPAATTTTAETTTSTSEATTTTAADATTTTTTAPATGEGEAEAPPEGAGEDEGLGSLVLVADLRAEAEVPGPGDTDGDGRIEIEATGPQTWCLDMVVTGLRGPVTGAHVHFGPEGLTGDVVVPIGEPTSTAGATDTWADVCLEVEDRVVDEVTSAPDAFYVNVHTDDHPDGAVRGQLRPASVFDLTLRSGERP